MRAPTLSTASHQWNSSRTSATVTSWSRTRSPWVPAQARVCEQVALRMRETGSAPPRFRSRQGQSTAPDPGPQPVNTCSRLLVARVLVGSFGPLPQAHACRVVVRQGTSADYRRTGWRRNRRAGCVVGNWSDDRSIECHRIDAERSELAQELCRSGGSALLCCIHRNVQQTGNLLVMQLTHVAQHEH